MIDIIINRLSEIFNIDVFLLFLVSGYFIYIIIFYTKNSTIWTDFQWSDRVIFGIVIGFVFYIFAILPLSILFGNLISLLPNKIKQIYEIKDVYSIRFQIYADALIIMLLLLMRRKTNFLSINGAWNVMNFIQKAYPIILYYLIFSIIFQTIASFLSNFYYIFYNQIYNFWIVQTALTFMASVLLLGGFIIIKSILAYTYSFLDKNLLDYINSFSNNINNKLLKTLSNYKVWVTLTIILSVSTQFIFINLDKQYQLITPAYFKEDIRHGNNIILYRHYNSSDLYFIKQIYERGMIKLPYFNYSTYIRIDNPSNFSTKIKLFNIKGPISYPNNFEFVAEKRGEFIRYLKFKFNKDISLWSLYEVEVTYYNIIKPNISIYDKINKIVSLNNGSYQTTYILNITNYSNEMLTTYHTFSGFKLDPRIINNITVACYEENIKKEINAFHYDIINNYFYPDIHVGPNKSIHIKYIIKGRP